LSDPPEISTLAAALRRRFFRHNLHALTLAAFSLLAAGALWGILYVVAAWLTVLSVTVVTGINQREAAMPAAFGRVFAFGALLLLALAWMRRAARPNDAPRDSKSFDEHFLDFVLATPAITLAIWSNLSAWQGFSALGLRYAARLLFAVLQQKRLPLTITPVLIPDDALREKIILGLLIIGVLELRQEDGAAYLRLARAAERNLLLPEAAALDDRRL
jgi:hypothetical protein